MKSLTLILSSAALLAVTGRAEVDPERLAFVGYSLGATMGARLLGVGGCRMNDEGDAYEAGGESEAVVSARHGRRVNERRKCGA